MGKPAMPRWRRTQAVVLDSRWASSGMSNLSSRVWLSIRSSTSVSRSKSNVAKPASLSSRATQRLRQLSRLLPLPWAKSTSPRGASGTLTSPFRTTPSASIVTLCRVAGSKAFLITVPLCPESSLRRLSCGTIKGKP